MRTYLFSASILALSLASYISAWELLQRDQPKVLQAPIHRRQDAAATQNPVQRDQIRQRQLRKRDPLNVQIDNYLSLYFANVSLGTPRQRLHLHLDTGSSDIWANAANSRFCETDTQDCAQSGTYSANDSSTYTYINSEFNISYVDGSGASGDYATDRLIIGGLSLDDIQFGIGYQSSSYQGILGIGYAANTASDVMDGQFYPNLPIELVSKGVIETNVYSLWLNDLDANEGAILFGGVNTDKYTGDLLTVPVIEDGGEYRQFIIALTDLGANGQSGTLLSNQNVPAVLDSGSSLTYVPESFAQAIYDTFGAQYDQSLGAAVIDCSRASPDENVIFGFSGASISVGLDELVLIGGYNGFNPICIMGILPASGVNPVLGDTFLRSAYVVYDLDGNTISLAQTNFNSTTDNIVQVTNSTGGNGIPGATPVPSPVTSVAGIATGQVVYVGGLPSVSIQQSTGLAVPTAAARVAGAGALAAAGIGALFAL